MPDIAVGWTALFRPSHAANAAVSAVVGGLAGSAALSMAVRRGWDPEPLIRALPGVTGADLIWARSAIATNPTRAFLAAAARGTPVKILVTEASRQGMATQRLIPLVVVNRAPRIGATALAMGVVGLLGRAPIGRHPRALAAIYTAGWVVFYAWFWANRRD